MKKRILCLTHSGDYYVIDRVMEELEGAGFKAVRLNTDRFPGSMDLSLTVNNSGNEIQAREELLDLAGGDIAAVWARKIWEPDISEDLDPVYRAACINESKEAMGAWLSCLYHLPWIDYPYIVRQAENKVLQLRTAVSSGLMIPDTIIGNDPSKVRTFYNKHNGKIVTKMLTALSISMDASRPFVYTSAVTEEDLESLDGLKYCPMIFQNMVDKEYELRVIYVDGEIFAGAINAKETEKGKVDWRLARPGECWWEHSELPEDIKDKIVVFMRSMKLIYGAIDIIKTPDDKYIFLEVNPGGEWGMIEKFLDYPVSMAFAKSFKKRI